VDEGGLARDPGAVAVIESALIFEVVRDARARGEKDSVLADWRRRIDRVIVVTAPDELKIARYAARAIPSDAVEGSLEAIEADARNRLVHQVPDAEKIAQADYVLDNSGMLRGCARRSKPSGRGCATRATNPASRRLYNKSCGRG